MDILHKMKDNLNQERVKGGLLSFQGKIGTIALDFLGKMTVFSSFDPTFPPVPPKIWFSYHTKIIFLKLAIIGLFARKVS